MGGSLGSKNCHYLLRIVVYGRNTEGIRRQREKARKVVCVAEVTASKLWVFSAGRKVALGTGEAVEED